MFPKEQIDNLKLLCPGIQQGDEGGVTYFLLPQLKIPDGCQPAQVDALLRPTKQSDGYNSRLYFAERIQSRKTLNWTGQSRILERNWHVFSWQVQAPNLTLIQILQEHLDALR